MVDNVLVLILCTTLVAVFCSSLPSTCHCSLSVPLLIWTAVMLDPQLYGKKMPFHVCYLLHCGSGSYPFEARIISHFRFMISFWNHFSPKMGYHWQTEVLLLLPSQLTLTLLDPFQLSNKVALPSVNFNLSPFLF